MKALDAIVTANEAIFSWGNLQGFCLGLIHDASIGIGVPVLVCFNEYHYGLSAFI